MSGLQRVRIGGVALVAGAVVAGAAAAALARRRAEAVPSGAPFGMEATTRSAEGLRAHTRVMPPAWEPRWARVLAEWQPQVPRGSLARVFAYLWAAPLSAAGLLVGAVTGVTPQTTRGVLLFTPARGLVRAILRVRGFSAVALGHVVVSTVPPDDDLLAHELLHVRQAERLGPLMAPLYLGLLAVYGYARHPLERAARTAARARRDVV